MKNVELCCLISEQQNSTVYLQAPLACNPTAWCEWIRNKISSLPLSQYTQFDQCQDTVYIAGAEVNSIWVGSSEHCSGSQSRARVGASPPSQSHVITNPLHCQCQPVSLWSNLNSYEYFTSVSVSFLFLSTWQSHTGKVTAQNIAMGDMLQWD